MPFAPDYLPCDGQQAASLGGCLSRYVASRWPTDTAKTIARRWDLDLETGRNVVKGHVGSRTLTAAIQADGYDLLDFIGFSLTGQSREDWHQDKITDLMGKLEVETEHFRALQAAARAIENAIAAREGEQTPTPHGSRPGRRRVSTR